jgi:hypothetical protein
VGQPARAPQTASPPPPALAPVPAREVQAWAAGSTWCMDPGPGTCAMMVYWRPGRDGRPVEMAMAALGTEPNSGFLAIMSSFELRDGRQCIPHRGGDVVYAAVGARDAAEARLAQEMEATFREAEREALGRGECIEFLRDPATGRIYQRRHVQGRQPSVDQESYTVVPGDPAAPALDL